MGNVTKLTATRRALQRAIFGACKARGIDTDDRHALQMRLTGCASMTDMSEPQMKRLLTEINGGEPSGRCKDTLPPGGTSSALIALWIGAWYLGVVRDRSTAALAAFVRRQTSVDAARFANPPQIAQVIEALKSWMAREGGVDWSPFTRADGARELVPAARVLEALWLRSHDDLDGLAAWAQDYGEIDGDYTSEDNETLNRLIKKLGRRKASA